MRTEFCIDADPATIEEVRAYLARKSGVKLIHFRDAELLRLKLRPATPRIRAPLVLETGETGSGKPESEDLKGVDWGGGASEVAAPAFEASLFHLTIQSEANLVAAGRALIRDGVEAWVAEPTREGPKSVAIADFLGKRGQS